MKRLGSAVGLAALISALTVAAPAAAVVTIGANVNDTSDTFSLGCVPDCTYEAVADFPAQPMQAPCAGTVTTWRVNAAQSLVTFRLRVIRDNGDGTYTSTASSAAQTTNLGTGVVAFPTSVSIAAGEYLGVDLSAGGGLLARIGVSDHIFRPVMVDGTPQAVFDDNGVAPLVNADVACASAPAGPTGQRAAALKKCKKKHSKRARRKCRRKAKLLPL